MIDEIVVKYTRLRKYLDNTLWIMADKFLGLGVAFLITVVVARYLGPEEFGIFSYVVSLVSLFAVAGHMGLAGLVVREIVSKPEERGLVLGTTFILKLIGMSLGYIALLIYGFYYEGLASIEFILIAILGSTLILRSVDTIDYWFQSFVQAKYVSISNLIGLFSSSIAKLLFVFGGFGLAYFVLANVIQVVILGLVLLFFYITKSEIRIREWSFSWVKVKELLGQGWLIYLGSIFAIINLKMDQVMLKWYQGAEQVGIYAVAAQISEAWYFIPTAIVASFFPKFIELREKDNEQYQVRLQQLFDILFLLALTVAVIVTFGGGLLINIFFGEQYEASAGILVVHIWAAIFIFMRALFSRWILMEDALVFSLITQGFGAIVNVILNYFWIQEYGALGAAYATLLSYAASSFIALLLYKKTRPVFLMMCKSIVMYSLLSKGIKNERVS
jgi:O-antigen/teichoic acid export membrane protein